MALFETFFTSNRLAYLEHHLDLTLKEDGRDLTSEAVFAVSDVSQGKVVAKQEGVLAGIPLVPLVLDKCAPADGPGWELDFSLPDGTWLWPGTVVARFTGQTRHLLQAERVILNFVCHLSGIATLTAHYARLISDSRTRLLDTRKTLPGLRYLEKYAVLVGGGTNHRMDLEEMVMLKDNHIDRAGSISQAVARVRTQYTPCPPIEVECRTLAEVEEAAAAKVERIMLDNMDLPTLEAALERIPSTIESEISGGVDETTIARLAECGADFISVGRLTHSAPALDLSMRCDPLAPESQTGNA